MVNSVALDVNHCFVFALRESYPLTGGDENAFPTFAIAKNDKVFWQAFANFVGRNSRHVFGDIFCIL